MVPGRQHDEYDHSGSADAPWTTVLPTGRACGQPVLRTGATVAHGSPAFAFGLTRLRLPHSRL